MIMTLRKDFLFCLQPTPRKGVHARWGRTAFFAGAFSKDEIQRLRRLSRGSADPREHSRS